jgi:hypothetical protein
VANEDNKPATTTFREVVHDGYQGALERGYQPNVQTPIPKPPQVGTTTVIPVVPAVTPTSIAPTHESNDKK